MRGMNDLKFMWTVSSSFLQRAVFPKPIAFPTPLRLKTPHSETLYPAYISSCCQSNKTLFSVFTYKAFLAWLHVPTFLHKSALSNSNEI